MRLLSLILPLCCALSASSQQTVKVSVKNPLNTPRTDQPVVIDLPQLRHIDVRSALVTLDGKEVPCQLDDLDQDEQFDELCFLADLKARETKQYTVTLYAEGEPRPYPARVYAEMVMGNKNVKEKNKQNNFIEAITARGDCAYSYNLQHHHGVDFESELNGIRIYFDQRQTLDLYGKFKKRLELKDTQFYTSDEQKQQGYGDDVLWVGNTFGLGAFRGWDGQQPTMIEPVRSRTQRVVSYGPLRTIVEVIDRGWQAPQIVSSTTPQPVNMTLRYTQYAGHRDTDVDVLFNRNADNYRFSTGIINVKGSVEFSDKKGLRACWGTDYPATDTLKWKRETVGLAVCVPQKNIVSEEPANKDNYAYVVKVAGRQMAYKVAYCSANEEFGFHSADEWFAWLRQWRREVDQPVVVSIVK
ncbi:MAG: DUF4861 domain-containing protein [Prevotella sp.]|nr:DUF4861 domain-containing protein [Prevotella sp.]